MISNYFAASLRVVIVSVGIFSTHAALQAHESHGKPQYGGIVSEAGKFQAELVVKNNLATIYLTEHGAALSTKGATGKLTVLSGNKTYSVALSAKAPNKLEAQLERAEQSIKIVAQITPLGKSMSSMRFELSR